MDRLIVAKGTVAGKRRVILEEYLNVVPEVRPFRVPCNLCLLPRRQLGICLAKELVGTFLKFGDFIGKVDVTAISKVLKFLDLAFKLADWLLKL